MNPLDDSIARLASAQHGVASNDQARRLGFTARQIQHRRRSGQWIGLGVRTFRLPGAPDIWEGRLIAAVLAAGDRAVVSHLSAARLHGLDSFDDDVVELLAVDGRYRSPSGVVVHRTRRLDRADVQVVRRHLSPAIRADRGMRAAGLITQFKATTASRTILDLAPVVDAERLGMAIDSAARLGLSSPSYLVRRLGAIRRPGRAGVRLLDEVLLDAGGHSWLERRFLRLMREAGLPRPACQVVHQRRGAFIARVDFDYSPRPLIVEVAGRRGHTSDADRASDARRRNELGALGIGVLDFVTTQVINDPAYVVETVRDRLEP